MVPGPDCMEDGRMCPKIKQLRGLYCANVPYFLDALRNYIEYCSKH